MSVVEPKPNPEAVAALLDTAWRLAATEERRTDSLDRKMATLATFASILVSIAAVGSSALATAGLPALVSIAIATGLFAAIGTLTAAVVVAVIALMPTEHMTLRTAYLLRFPTWREVRKPAERVRGESLQSLVESLVSERDTNHVKSQRVRLALWLLLVGLLLIAADGLTLSMWRIST